MKIVIYMVILTIAVMGAVNISIDLINQPDTLLSTLGVILMGVSLSCIPFYGAKLFRKLTKD